MSDFVIKDVNGKLLFSPWDGPQKRFWTCKSRYALIAGAGFTGKSDLLRWYPFQQVEEDNQRIANGEIETSTGHALYLRREFPMLREVKNRCSIDFPSVCPDLGSKEGWKAQENTYFFPNGYRYTFGHMQDEESWQVYQGWQLSMILFDELCSFTEKQFNMLDTWLRPAAGSRLTAVMRSGANPIGPGRDWVKKRFGITKGKRVNEFEKTAVVEVEDEFGKRKKETKRRGWAYYHVLVTDNKSVDQAEYLASFEGKPANVVKALRDGDFDAATGDLVGYSWDDDVHAIRPFRLPSLRPRFSTCFYAYAGATALWFDVDYDGNLICYRDLHLKNHTAEMFANRMRELEEEAGEWQPDKERGSKLTLILGPGTVWPKEKQRGPSVAETFRRTGFYVRPGDDNYQSAADQIRSRLLRRSPHPTEKDERGKPALIVPGLRFFKTCLDSLEQIPSMTADKNDPDSPDPKVEASAYKALCYAAMSRPIAAERHLPKDEDWETAEKPKTKRKSKTGMPGLW